MTKKSLALALGLLLACAGAATAQIATGNVYGTAEDESGAVLPGVNVSISGELGTRSTVSGPEGAFRFLNLTRGSYTLTLSLAGFANLTRNIQVTTGENVNLVFTMKVSTVQETIEVAGETPLVDTKRRGTATTMTNEELAQVPNARDPWAVLRAVPGVLVDRVNIAGNENGQQANYAGKGSNRDDSMWNLDGMVITDMSATGASPAYFDFEAFDEIAVTTGGNDLATQSGGIGINLTTKRGTNRFHGGARFLLAHDDLSFGNVPDSLANDPRLENEDGTRRDKADHIQQISDYGFDLGGPIIKDRLWFYGTYGKQDIRLVRLNGTPDKTLLPTYNVKVNWQATQNTMVSAFWFNNKKQKFGRNRGWFGVQETDDFLYDQAGEVTEGGLPEGFWKLQVDHTFSPNFFMSAKAGYYDTGFGLQPRGGMERTWTIDFYNGEAIGGGGAYIAVRPQKNVTIDANYFFEGLGGQNELKMGFSWRDYRSTNGYIVGGTEMVGYMETATGGTVELARTGPQVTAGNYWSVYVGDVLATDRFTFNAGVRWDLQRARNVEGDVAGNATFPDILPSLVYAGDSGYPIDWSFWSPRVGMSYALTDSRKTVLRASYALYGGMLSYGADINDINPISWGALAYGWNDLNGDRFVQENEIDFDDFQYSYGVNLDDPSSATSSNRIDKDYKPKRDHEFVVGIDHEFSGVGGAFAVGAAYSYRRTSDLYYTPRLGGSCPLDDSTLANCRIIQPNEYIRNDPATANGYTAFTYSPPSDLISAGGGGRFRTNAPGYTRTFNGLELTAIKRLSNRWMGRVAFSWNSWTEDWDGTPYSIDSDNGNPTSTENDPLKPGGQVTILSGGSGKASFYTNAKWQLYANGLWQGPGGVDLSGAFFARQGGAYPVALRLSGGGDGTNSALATDQIDSLRYKTLWNFDLRLAKTIRFGEAGLTLAAEWFNVFNTSTVLSRYRYATGSAFTDDLGGAIEGRGRIEEIISPSIFRIGARLQF